MIMQEFKELTRAVYDEYENMSETFGLDKVPKKSINFVHKNIKRYSKMYSKPLFLKEKRRLEIEMAFDTMPHGFLWKIFHAKLWKKMQLIMAEEQRHESEEIEEEKPEEKPTIQVPAVIIEKELVPVIEDETSDFNADFD